MGSLFLPFTPNGKATELLAIEVKKRLDLGPAAAVDPVDVLPRVPARLVEPRELWKGCPETARRLFVEYGEQWSGIGLGESPDDGASLILLNPSHAMTRRRATLMEEIVHIVLKHPKSALTRASVRNPWKRSHDADVEDEAFAVGAACLLPYPEMFRAIRHAHETAASIAARFGVSLQCVEFRIKRAGLSNVYRKRCAAGFRFPRRIP
jgi:uncharacterized protein DUF955